MRKQRALPLLHGRLTGMVPLNCASCCQPSSVSRLPLWLGRESHQRLCELSPLSEPCPAWQWGPSVMPSCWLPQQASGELLAARASVPGSLIRQAGRQCDATVPSSAMQQTEGEQLRWAASPPFQECSLEALGSCPCPAEHADSHEAMQHAEQKQLAAQLLPPWVPACLRAPAGLQGHANEQAIHVAPHASSTPSLRCRLQTCSTTDTSARKQLTPAQHRRLPSL